MFSFLFDYVLPIISFAMAIFFFIKFYKFKDVLDDGTITLIRQVKSWWGTSQGLKSADKRKSTKAYNSGKAKVGAKIKGLIPFGILNELTDDEVHDYLMHEDTVNFFIKFKQLTGGEITFPDLKLPKLPGQGGGGPDRMKPE